LTKKIAPLLLNQDLLTRKLKEDLKMDIRTMFLQLFDLHKTTFENGYAALVTIQDQAEKTWGTFMNQASWVPPESRSAADDMIRIFKKNRDDFKKAVDEGYTRIGGFIESALGNIRS
jgi:hypothetical protein